MENPVEIRYTINSSDINGVGVDLGYDWNTICDEVGNRGLHGQDGCGCAYVCKNTLDGFINYYGDILGHILYKLFEMNPEMNELYINDDF